MRGRSLSRDWSHTIAQSVFRSLVCLLTFILTNTPTKLFITSCICCQLSLQYSSPFAPANRPPPFLLLWFLAFDLSLNQPHTLALSIAHSLTLPFTSFIDQSLSLVFSRCVSSNTYINYNSHFSPLVCWLFVSQPISHPNRSVTHFLEYSPHSLSPFLSAVCRNTPSFLFSTCLLTFCL